MDADLHAAVAVLRQRALEELVQLGVEDLAGRRSEEENIDGGPNLLFIASVAFLGILVVPMVPSLRVLSIVYIGNCVFYLSAKQIPASSSASSEQLADISQSLSSALHSRLRLRACDTECQRSILSTVSGTSIALLCKLRIERNEQDARDEHAISPSGPRPRRTCASSRSPSGTLP